MGFQSRRLATERGDSMIRGQLVWRGVTFGLDTEIEIVNIKGLGDLPGLDYTGTPRPRAVGAFPGEAYAQARVVEVELEIAASNTAAARKLLRDTTNYTKAGITEPLTFLVDEDEIHLSAQLLRRSLPLDNKYEVLNTAVLQWTCPDPRLYGAPKNLEIPFPDEGVGVPYPFPYPTDYVLAEPGSRTAVNAGNEAAPAIISIPGPCLLPWVRFSTPDGTSQRLDVNTALAATELLVLDTLNGTAKVGNSNRFRQLSGAILSELLLPPGGTTISWGAFSGTPGGPLTVTYADAEM